MGARSAGNPHAACDVEGAGNVARPGGLGLAGAPVLDPTCERLGVKVPGPTRLVYANAGLPTRATESTVAPDAGRRRRETGAMQLVKRVDSGHFAIEDSLHEIAAKVTAFYDARVAT